jgi:membrane protease subunit HflK
MRRLRYLLPLLFFAYLLTGISQVGYDERAVVRRFGRVVARPGPGLWVGLPWGIDTVDRVQVRAVRQLAVGFLPEEANDAPGNPPGQLLTGDQNLVNVKLVVEYAIDDRDGEFEQYVANKDQVDRVLSREAEAAAAEWVGGRKVDEVLSGRAALARRVSDQLPDRLQPHRLGIVVQRVSVEELAAPVEVQDAFQQVNQAQTAIRTRRNQAEQEAQRQRSEATAAEQRLLREGEAYKQEKDALARAEADAFLNRLTEYRRAKATNPDALAAIWREEMGKVLAGVKDRGGRVEVLDDALGPNGIELNQFVPTKKR